MAWYHIPGPDQDVAVMTELSCMRNIADLPFPERLDTTRARTIISRASAILSSNGFTDVGLTELPRAAAYTFAERQYVHRDIITHSRPHALLINEPCGLSVTVGGEDHFTITALRTGLSAEEAFTAIADVEAIADSACALAFDERLGYLTRDPARVGTGLLPSVTLFLPMVASSGCCPTISRRLSIHNLILTPLSYDHSAPSDIKMSSNRLPLGNLYRLTSYKTLGKSEDEVVARITSASRYLIDIERRLRTHLSDSERTTLTDRLKRSYALLSIAPHLSLSEAIERLGDLRLGAAMRLFPNIKIEALTATLMEILPAGLSLTAGEGQTDDRALRGTRIRERLFSEEAVIRQHSLP